MRLTLGQAQRLLAEYTDYGTCPTDPRVAQWINLAVERLVPVLHPEKTVARYEFPLQPPTFTNQFITLPADIKTVKAAGLIFPDCQATGGQCTCPLYQLVSVRSRWYELLPGGPAGFGPAGFTPCAPNVLMDAGTGWSTIAEPWVDTPPMFIRVYADIPQPSSEGNIYVNGLDPDGNQLVSTDSIGFHNAMAIPIPIQGQNYQDSPVAVSEVFNITKPVTVGRIRLYAVSLDLTTQDPIAVYAPGETAPDYRRYTLTWCGDLPPSSIVVIAKRQFVWQTDPDADLLITHVGALQEALMSIRYSKAGHAQLAQFHFAEAVKFLESETLDYDGDRATTLQLQDLYAGGDIWSLR